MSRALQASPVSSKLNHEVRDPRTGLVLGWVNGDKALQQALTRRGFRLRKGVRRQQRTSEIAVAG
jgi:hypothetical protein